MRLVYSFNCYRHTEALLKRCRISKDLYNQALHVCLEALKQDTPKYLNYYDLVNLLVKNNVGTLVCGRNKGWKDSIDLGRRNNQQFV